MFRKIRTFLLGFKMEYQKRFLRLPQVIERSGYKRSNIYLLMNQGKFPKAVTIGPRAVAWLESEVETWMQDRIDDRDQAA